VVFRKLPDGSIDVLVIKDSHGNFAFPKGRIEEGETPVQAARRETNEEVDLHDLTLIQPLGKSEFDFTDKWETPGEQVHKSIHHFLFQAPADANPKPEAERAQKITWVPRVQEVAWVPLKELERLITYKTLQPIVGRIVQALNHV
jgi:ADP-ribose pyrophosphatase YjhB (NUDIX family)